MRLNWQQRSMLCQLRCGILSLRIETCHYGSKPLPSEDCICLLCNSEPETELHFLLDCNLYHQQTDIYAFVNSINLQFTNLDVPSKFDLIMNNPNDIKCTAQFIVTCYDLRCKHLFNEINFNVNNDI